ncbi:hypothetical protein Taro_055054 [Colocasia esculenta]|uniref:Uncharacterized protein n=1 Tax=Colocasia esculenta TaxID=4460 RepID=A0A843XT36_COLES|nr:hypothetical protein [Colocasia esculenta]
MALLEELGVGRVAEAAVVPCVVSSSESEYCELLYLSELRVVLASSRVHISLDYFSFWVFRSIGGDANFRVPGGGLGGRVCGFPARFVCVLQEGCSCCRSTSVESVVARCVRAVVARLAVLPRITLCSFWRRFFPGVLCVRLGPPLCCPYGSKCAVGLDCVLFAWHCRMRCYALGRASGFCIGQVALLFVSEFLGCASGTSCVLVVQAICFIPYAWPGLTNGGLVSAVGVWLAVLLVEVSILCWDFPSYMWKRLVVCVSFLCFSLVARGGDAPLWCCVARVHIVATFW